MARYAVQVQLESCYNGKRFRTPPPSPPCQQTPRLFLSIALGFKVSLGMNFGENGVSAGRMVLPPLEETFSVLHNRHSLAREGK